MMCEPVCVYVVSVGDTAWGRKEHGRMGLDPAGGEFVGGVGGGTGRPQWPALQVSLSQG